MRLILTFLLISSPVFFYSCDEIADNLNSLSDVEIVEGLKKALDIGLDKAVTSASATDGYLKNEIIKILLPEEVKALQSKIQNESFTVVNGLEIKYKTIYDTYIALDPNIETDVFDELVAAMNRGAESAAEKALPIFGDALLNMSFDDALGILQGGETAATDYFSNTTKGALSTAFQPDIKTALDNTKANALYESAVGFLNYQYEFDFLNKNYNVKVGDHLKVDNLPESIDEYATNKAISGLFYLIGEQEKKIREDPFAWASDIIEKVFGSKEANFSN